MSHTSRTLRFALLTASTSLALGGALLPTGAFAAPAPAHAVTLPAEDGDGARSDHTGRHGRDGGWNWNRHRDEDENRHDDTPPDDSADTDTTEPADSEDGIVPQEHCNDPKALPGLCVDGKPLPKGDNSVTVPQAPKLCLGIDTPEQCADRQKELVPAPRPNPPIGLAV